MRPLAHQLIDQCQEMVKESLKSCANGDEAREKLSAAGMSQLLDEFSEENNKILQELEQSSKPNFAVINRPEQIHFGLLMGLAAEPMQKLIAPVASQLVRKYWPLSGIWKGYADALVHFVSGTPQPVEVRKPKGAEKLYVPYIDYMISVPADREQALAAINNSFERRNRDKRSIDWIGLDGDGTKPVNWDFRLHTLQTVG